MLPLLLKLHKRQECTLVMPACVETSKGCCLVLRTCLWFPAAPEVISQGNTGNYDGKAVDVWACGVMLFVMLFCQYPFERPEDEQEKIQTKRYQMVSSHPINPLCSSCPISMSLEDRRSASLLVLS